MTSPIWRISVSNFSKNSAPNKPRSPNTDWSTSSTLLSINLKSKFSTVEFPIMRFRSNHNFTLAVKVVSAFMICILTCVEFDGRTNIFIRPCNRKRALFSTNTKIGAFLAENCTSTSRWGYWRPRAPRNSPRQKPEEHVVCKTSKNR